MGPIPQKPGGASLLASTLFGKCRTRTSSGRPSCLPKGEQGAVGPRLALWLTAGEELDFPDPRKALKQEDIRGCPCQLSQSSSLLLKLRSNNVGLMDCGFLSIHSPTVCSRAIEPHPMSLHPTPQILTHQCPPAAESSACPQGAAGWQHCQCRPDETDRCSEPSGGEDGQRGVGKGAGQMASMDCQS